MGEVWETGEERAEGGSSKKVGTWEKEGEDNITMPSILQSRKGYREEAQKGDGSPEYKVRELVGLDSLQRTVFWGKRRNK